MKLLLALLFLASANANAAKLVSSKALQYLPVFGIGSTSSVAYTNTSGETFVWNPVGGGQTTVLRVLTTSGAYISHGTAPSATALDMYLPANTEIILEILAGSKVSAVSAGGPGRLFTTEIITYPSKD